MSIEITRRHALGLLATSGAAALVGCSRAERPSAEARPGAVPVSTLGGDAVLRVEPLQQIWQTQDPFLFCAYHLDAYPAGNAQMGPAASLAGRQLGRDFAGVGGWNMYHGRRVPGFPRHPHRGFETVTVVQRGLLDHSDSLGATARYGQGDVQWLTAGAGVLHAEMFPLLDDAGDNPLELFQIWLNLPAANKFVDPHFKMLWQPTIPTFQVADAAGRATRVKIVAGSLANRRAPAPTPQSWASESDSHVAIWTLGLEPGATFTIPAAPAGVTRSLYYYRGAGLHVGGRAIPDRQHVVLAAQSDVALNAGPGGAELLLLQGKPIGEPVARHGPFVMNTEAQIRDAYADYQRTEFGGWPWPSDENVHPLTQGRFALRPDGEIETPTSG